MTCPRRARHDRRCGLRRLPRPQGPGAQVQAPVPGADLRRASSCSAATAPAPTRGDRRGPADRRAAARRSGPSAPARRSCSRRAPARTGSVKLIDLITARLDAKTDCYLAELPSLQLNDVRIDDAAGPRERADADRRLLRRGRRSSYDAIIAQEKSGRPFGIDVAAADPAVQARRAATSTPRARQASPRRSGRTSCCAASASSRQRSPTRASDVLLLRMVPFVERNYNMVELGPRGTGKSHLFQQVSPYAHLVSGGKATVARMFVNNATGQRGLVCQYDVVCFDEVSGVSFDQKDGVNIMKGYMESGEFSRGKESIRADGGIVMVGNFDVDVAAPAAGRPPASARCRRRCATTPRSWTASTPTCPAGTSRSSTRDLLTDHFGLVSDFLSRVLEPAADAEPADRAPGARPLRRRAQRPRHDGGQQDGQRAAEAAVPRSRDCRSPTRTWSGRCGWRWSAAGG